MARFKYSTVGLDIDPDKTAFASGREMDISPKHAREICHAIKGMLVDRAKTYLEEVMAMKRSVPFKRYNRKIAHRSDLVGWHSGRYPVKAAEHILLVLNNLEKNAENKDLEVDRLLLFHAAVQRGRKIKRYFPRAMGSTSPKNKTLTHVEVAAEEI
ncbi:MAG: 50S ribosomal protein L22 [Candidatus Heimdallarchaeota archaeon]|nr:50S ribosomal protein L22 [Candidatus Heimdallarchaeota archaeon]